MPERIAFVTGKLARSALERETQALGEKVGFLPTVLCAPITVAALMTTRWLVGKLRLPPDIDRVVLPGWCGGDIAPLSESLGGVAVVRGPKDLQDLPDFFAVQKQPADYGASDIEILAEINQANRQSLPDLLREAERLRADGADIIDLGCTPGEPWTAIEPAFRALKREGYRLSVDTFDADEAAAATAGGAELVLSVDAARCDSARRFNGAEVVLIPDNPRDASWLQNLKSGATRLEELGIRFRIDPVLEPIGFGFARSLERYLRAREEFPHQTMLMGVGNLTELTAVDSAGINAILAGFCEELGIRSVLTTEVIHWARSSVRELAIARQLMYAAVRMRVLPKHIDDRLVTLRAGAPIERGEEELRELRERITDANVRIFAERGRVIALNRDHFLEGTDPFEIFPQLGISDPAHAFYLGWEMMKARLALDLGKRYVQDESLPFGFLTRTEPRHRGPRAPKEGQ